MEPFVLTDGVTRQFVVRGRVQRVRFRAATRRKALELGVHGFARNLDDGAVEVLAMGSRDAVQSLAQWLAKGPPLARVDSIDEWPAAAFEGEGFSIL